MSFMRVPRSQSLSSLNSSRASKKRRKAKPAWDDSVTDLSQHRATPEEVEHRRSVHKSKNLKAVHQEKLEKQIAKARARNEQSHNTSDYHGTRLLREILYDESQLQEALSHSDRVMSVVQDLFGDDPKRHTTFPNVTLAPGQKPGLRPQGPISEAPETPSRLTVLSESVMNSQALNEMDGNETSGSDEEDDKENLQPMSFQSSLNVDRFQDYLQRQQAKQASHPYDSTHASLLPNSRKDRTRQDSKQQTTETSLDSSQVDAEGDWAPPTNAINDTVKVKKKSRSRIQKEKQSEERNVKREDAHDLSTVLKGLAQQMSDYEESTGRQPHSTLHGDGQHSIAGVSGYTTMLVQTTSKLIGYLKETESQMSEERQTREQMQYQMAEQRILLDAVTADLLATQDLQLASHQEFKQFMTQTRVQLSGIQESLSNLGLQTSSSNNFPQAPLKGQSHPQRSHQSQPPPSAVEHQPAHLQSVQSLSVASQQPVTRAQVTKLDELQRGQTLYPQEAPHGQSLMSQQGMLHHMTHSHPSKPATSVPLQSPSSGQPLTSQQGLQHQGLLHQMSSSHSSRPVPSVPHQSVVSQHQMQMHKAQQHQSSDQHQEQITATHPATTHQVPTSSTISLADEFSNALQQATMKAGTTSHTLPTTTSNNRNFTSTGHHNTNLSKVPNDQHEIPSTEMPPDMPGTLSSKFTSSFLEDKRHLGTRDTHIPFQPAILLSPPRQRDRSSVVRPRVASVEAHPMSSSDGSAIGTIHSIQRGTAQTYTVPSSLESRYSNKLPTAVPISRYTEEQRTGMSISENPTMPMSGQTDADLVARIAQLTKQHEEAQSRLNQLKGSSPPSAEGNASALRHAATGAVTATHARPKLANSSGLPVSPPISPIPFEPKHMKHVNKGPSHLVKEGRTIHVSIPRPDDLEISATSTPSPKTSENRTRARQSNVHVSQSSHPWKTPEKHGDSQEGEHFFALTAHMST